MADIVEQAVHVEAGHRGIVRITHHEHHANGVELAGLIILEASSAGWLANEVERASTAWSYPRTHISRPPDQFIVFVGGTDWQPFVHIHNLRDPASALGGDYVLAMTAELARTLPPLLRTFAGENEVA